MKRQDNSIRGSGESPLNRWRRASGYLLKVRLYRTIFFSRTLTDWLPLPVRTFSEAWECVEITRESLQGWIGEGPERFIRNYNNLWTGRLNPDRLPKGLIAWSGTGNEIAGKNETGKNETGDKGTGTVDDNRTIKVNA